MNITKENILQLIKEEMNMHIVEDEAADPRGSEQHLIDLAREEVSTIDAYRGVARGDFEYHHVAAALRKLADEYQEAADRSADLQEVAPMDALSKEREDKHETN